ncbi:hypothetical protein KAU45_03150, partial [bacterium]|nr:hypothetical protein [bacterium]
MKNLITLLLTVFLISSALGITWSDWSYIIDSEHGDYRPVASYTPSDELFVVWFSAWALFYYDISFASVAEDGTLTIPPARIFTEDSVDDRAPTVTVDSQGHAHVFWRRWTDGDFHIWYTQIDTEDGSYVVDPKPLLGSNTPDDLYMYAVPDHNDDVHLLYFDFVWSGEVWWEAALHAKISSSGNLLASGHLITDNPYYERVYYDKGIAIDSDNNVHVVYTYDPQLPDYVYKIIYRKLDGDTGEPLTPIIDLSYYGRQPIGDTVRDPGCDGPAICVDSYDKVHIAYRYTNENYEAYIAYVVLDKDGQVLRPLRLAYHDPDLLYQAKNFFIEQNDRIFLFSSCKYDILTGQAFFEFNTDGDVIGEPALLIDTIGDHYHVGPTGCVGESGMLRLVGEKRWDPFDEDVVYVHQLEIEGRVTDDPDLNALSEDDGILLSWREEGVLIGSTWRLERDGDRLVNLSGNDLYRYLDRNAEPNITHLYTLEATLPNGSILRFGPVEATWPGPDADRFTLYAPYPCPARDMITLTYYLPNGCSGAVIEVYDLSGRRLDSIPLTDSGEIT